MSKYKVGDEIYVKVKIAKYHPEEGGEICVIPTTVEIYADNLTRHIWVDEKAVLDMTAEDAWETAKKIIYKEHQGEFSDDQLCEIFGYQTVQEILDNFTPQQAKEKIEAWESGKDIGVNDVVYFENDKAVVTGRTGEIIQCLFSDGYTCRYPARRLRRTNFRVDIASVLEQIGG